MKPSSWDTYVLINAPEYKFRLFEGGAKSMEFAVVVGKRSWQTPIFSSTLKYIVLNPAWNVPDNIARDEIIPKIVKPSNWDTYVLINAPEYKFRLFEGGAKSMEFAVVVGKRSWQTPIFSSTLKYIVLNPAWNVPDNIARDEIIPKIVRNIGVLKRKNMVVRKDYNIDSTPVDPKSVDWKLYLTPEYKKKALPYKLIQKASNRNALGTVKFMFPNRFSVYMHDTQAKSLFGRDARAYSHGCIRLSKPQKLLEHISTNYSSKSFSTVQKIASTKKTSYLNLDRYIPVKITYLTAYVKEDGSLSFFSDMYGFDSSQRVKGSM